MFIHTVSEGESLYSIGRKYGTSATRIKANNDLSHPERLSVGQKLLILTPTRTYTVRGGDSLEGIARRFGVREAALLRANPELSGAERTHPEQILAIRYDVPYRSAAVMNGYLYKGFTKERLMLALAHAGFITVSAYKVLPGGRITRLFDDGGAVRLVREAGKVPLMRVYDARTLGEVMAGAASFINELTELAVRGGYGGITLAMHKARCESGFCDFLFELKREMIDKGLSLTLEVDGNEGDACEIADACVLLYDKCALSEIPSFKDGEAALYEDFATRADSTRAFVDLAPFAYANGEPMLKKRAEEIAYGMKREILYDSERKISHFEYSRFGVRGATRVVFEALENIKAKLELASELGFMGVSFDVERVPISHLMMCVGLFASGNGYCASSLDM